MARRDVIKAGKVFVAGGLPTLTYIPRSQNNLEQKVLDYLDEGHRILSVSGPTKTGKTVLMRKMLRNENAIWLSGGTLNSLEDFWSQIADELNLFTEIESTDSSAESEGRVNKGEAGVAVVKVAREGQSATTYTTESRAARNRPIASAARDGLRGALSPLVIDDFHYVDQEIQMQIVRGLKDLVFDGLPVVVIAVPHRAYDVVRVEKEMTGRVEQLEVGFWSTSELMEISRQGFSALNVIDRNDAIAKRLAEESFSSPHLMQDFCLQICKVNNIREKSRMASKLKSPNWAEFFSGRSSSTSKTAFEMLARGPRQRTDRKPRILHGGTATDIYGAVLYAIAFTGPLTSLTYEGLRSALRNVLDEDLPQRHEVTRVLEEMSKIAKRDLEGEPVVDYDESLSTLHISDPYFAFYLRWKINGNVAPHAEAQVSIPAQQIVFGNQVAVGRDFHGNVIHGDVQITGESSTGPNQLPPDR
ncbi:ATP-binding protein [Actinomadura madurae]|uniref:ATP-binding protein n=1 Tax=Actinomadura madurae TaxID=1993 RepID=UPI00399C0056